MYIDDFGLEIIIKQVYTNNIIISVSAHNMVDVTAPISLSEDSIKAYIRANIWRIKEEKNKLKKKDDSILGRLINKQLSVFGKLYFVVLYKNELYNDFSIDDEHHIIIIRTKTGYSSIEIADYIRKEYYSYIKKVITDNKVFETVKKIIEVNAEHFEIDEALESWAEFNKDNKTVYINPQITEHYKSTENNNEKLIFVMLDCLYRSGCVTEKSYDELMDLNIKHWKSIKLWVDKNKPSSISRNKFKSSIVLVEKSEYNEIKRQTINKFCELGLNCSRCVVDVQNIISLSCNQTEYFSYKILVSCYNDESDVFWYEVKCDKTKDEFLICDVELYTPTSKDIKDGFKSFIPPVCESDIESEAKRFLKKFYPKALTDSAPVPIMDVAENMGLSIKEVAGLLDYMGVFGITVFEDGDIKDTIGNIFIADAPKNTIFVDTDIFNEADINERNLIIAHELYHWYKHKPFFNIVNRIKNVNLVQANAVLCLSPEYIYKSSSKEPTAFDILELQAEGVAAHILLPTESLKKYFSTLEKIGCIDVSSPVGIARVIRSFSDCYGIPERMAISRLEDSGCIMKMAMTEKSTDGKDLLKELVKKEIRMSDEKSRNIRGLNDSFSATLKALIDADKKYRVEEVRKDADEDDDPDYTASPLAKASRISDRTLSRMRTKDGQEVTLQMVLGICCGLNLSLPETEMLLDKSPFRLQPTIREHYVYKTIIPLFKYYSTKEINKMLTEAGIRQIGKY